MKKHWNYVRTQRIARPKKFCVQGHVQKCLGNTGQEIVVSDGCMSGGLEFMTELRGWLFSACKFISMSIYFDVITVGGWRNLRVEDAKVWSRG